MYSKQNSIYLFAIIYDWNYLEFIYALGKRRVLVTVENIYTQISSLVCMYYLVRLKKSYLLPINHDLKQLPSICDQLNNIKYIPKYDIKKACASQSFPSG